MKNGVYALTAIALLFFILGCGSSQPQFPRTNYTLHVYNSTGASITVAVPPDPTRSADDEGEVEAVESTVVIPAYKSTTFAILHAQAVEISVLAPDAAKKFNQTIDIQPNTRMDLLVDIGARGAFYKFPIVYTKFKNLNKPVAAPAPIPLGGPQALYDLDHRYPGINKRLSQQVSVPQGSDSAIGYALVDAKGLERASQGGTLDP